MDSNPIEQFKLWFEAAKDLPQHNAMALATAVDNRPTVRMVLLKGISQRGFEFYTNYSSVKAEQLAINPHCALVFYWPQLGRQIRVEGTTQKLTSDQSRNYFATRSRNSQISAWASKQSKSMASREEFIASVNSYTKEFAGKEVPLPEFWGGYLVVPSKFEFWQDQPDRMHHRFCYKLVENIWQLEQLYP